MDAVAWNEHRRELVRFVSKRVADEATAEDIVHDVLLKAHARHRELREPSKLRSWLYQITRNTIVDHFRSHRPSDPLPDDLPPAPQATGGESPEQELARCLTPLLETLPLGYRQALRMVEFEGATGKELAARLGLSVSGAKSRVQRGRRMLLRALLNCCHVERDSRGGITAVDIGDQCTVCPSANGKDEC